MNAFRSLVPRYRRQPTLTVAVVAVFVLTGLLILYQGASVSPQSKVDDAYITYRYADNLRSGLGLVYNRNEWVLGTTTPLFAMLLGLLGTIFSNLELVGHWFGVVCWISATWITVILFLELNRPFAAVAGGIIVALQPTLLLVLGMETHLVIALMLALAWASITAHRHLAGILSALLIMTRLDGALWALLLGIETWRRDRRFPVREAVIAGATLVPWLLYATWRYGSFLPNSILAKLSQAYFMPFGIDKTFLQWFWSTEAEGIPQVAIVIAVVVLLVGLMQIILLERKLWWLVVWPLSYVLIYTRLKVAPYPWYFPPLATALWLIVGLGIGHLFGDPISTGEERISIRASHWILRPAVSASGIIILVVLVAGIWQRTLDIQAMAPLENPAVYRPASQWLAENTPDDATVATIEIGIIGFFSHRRILDTMGLVSSEMTNHLVGWRETLCFAVAELRPEYVIVLPETQWDWIVEQWWFIESYAPAARFGKLTVYELNSLPEAESHSEVVAKFNGGFDITGMDISSNRITPGDYLDLRLHVDVLRRQPARYVFTVYLIDAQTEQHFAELQSEPFSGGYQTDRWQPGDKLELPFRLSVPRDLIPGTYRLGIVVTALEQGAPLPFQNASSTESFEVRAGWLRSGHPPMPPIVSGLLSQSLLVRWQQGIELVGIAVPSEPVQRGADLPVVLTWRPTSPVSRNLKVFVHVIDSEGVIVSQSDQKPFEGRFPTPGWDAGDRFQDVYHIAIPDSVTQTSLGLRIGLYDDIGRLMFAGGDEDYLQLADIIHIASDGS